MLVKNLDSENKHPLGEDAEQLKILQSVFRAKGKTVSYGDIVMYLAIDKKWGPPSKVRTLLKDAESQGLIRTSGEDSAKTVELLISSN